MPSSSDSLLVIVRHGQSETNARNTFTGLQDPPLTSRGEQEASAAGVRLRDLSYTFDIAYTSLLRRASASLELLLSSLGQSPPPPILATAALNERDYGELNGLEKSAVRDKYGVEQFDAWRRGYTAVPPGGESLEQTEQRVRKWWEEEGEPTVRRGQRVLIMSHGNTLRALIMVLEEVGPEEVQGIELGYAAMRAYRFNEAGQLSVEKFVVDGVEGGWS